jgi:hypothetical protein
MTIAEIDMKDKKVRIVFGRLTLWQGSAITQGAEVCACFSARPVSPRLWPQRRSFPFENVTPSTLWHQA